MFYGAIRFIERELLIYPPKKQTAKTFFLENFFPGKIDGHTTIR